MSSTASIYQALDEETKNEFGRANDTDQLSFDCQSVSFYECRQAKCFRPPDAFDFSCLCPADYLRLREMHELDDVTQYASACDYEQVAHCIAVERSYWRRRKPHRKSTKKSVTAP